MSSSFQLVRAAEDAVTAVAWPTPSTLVTGAIPGSVTVWAVGGGGGGGGGLTRRGGAAGAHALGVAALLHDSSGERVVSVGLHDGALLLHAAADGAVVGERGEPPAGAAQEATAGAYHPARAALALGTRRGTVRVVELVETTDGAVNAYSFKDEADIDLAPPDAGAGAAGGGGSGGGAPPPAARGAHVMAVAFDPTGRCLAAADAAGRVVVVDVDARAVLSVTPASAGALRCVAWTSDGRAIVAAGDEHRVVVLDASALGADGPAGAPRGGGPLPFLAALAGHTGFVVAAAAAPHKPLVATTGNDRTVRVWDVRTRECVGVVDGLPERAWALAWSPDGAALAVGTESGALALWTPNLTAA